MESSFENPMKVLRAICDFIFIHLQDYAPTIEAFTFGISDSVISARYKGKCIEREHLAEYSNELFNKILEYDGQGLAVVSFTGLHAIRLEYSLNSIACEERDNDAPRGALLRVTMNTGNDLFLQDYSLFYNAFIDSISNSNSVINTDKLEVFLNGTRIGLSSNDDFFLPDSSSE